MRRRGLFLKSLILLLLPILSFSQSGLDEKIAELSQSIANEMTTYQKTTIAVVEFSDLQGNVTDFGRFLAEELITKLHQTRKFKVAERQMLNKIIAEQKLSLTGMVDPASAKQLGKLFGVDAIVSGSITDLSQTLRINARLISTVTGEIFAVASTVIYKDESVSNLLSKGSTTPSRPTISQAAPTSPRIDAMKKTEANNFTFVLKRVAKSGATVTFEVLVSNNDQDREFRVYKESSRIIDDVGNEYKNCQLRIGNRDEYRLILVTGVPVIVTLTFEKISTQITQIPLLEMACYDRNFFVVQFRNIPISSN